MITLKQTIKAEHAGLLLRDYLTDVLHLSRRLVKKLKTADGKILVNGVEVTVRYELKAGDVLELVFPPETKDTSIILEDKPLDILYEDDAILIINKPPAMPSIPSQLHPTGTVANRLLAYYQRKQLPYTVHIVTRLDKDTSGLMLVAKNQYSHSLLARQQQMQQITRTYHAIVHGKMEEQHGTITFSIARERDSIIKRTISKDGQRAITHFHVKERFANYTYVAARLETGRTHQIRVHFAAIGHPLVGDDLYGGRHDVIERQALHCAHLHFTHPFSGEKLTFYAPLPADMRTLLQKIATHEEYGDG